MKPFSGVFVPWMNFFDISKHVFKWIAPKSPHWTKFFTYLTILYGYNAHRNYALLYRKTDICGKAACHSAVILTSFRLQSGLCGINHYITTATGSQNYFAVCAFCGAKCCNFAAAKCMMGKHYSAVDYR